MESLRDADAPSRYVVGIDLGTTNSAVAYVDTTDPEWRTHDLPVPQLGGRATVEARETLPSFHYEAAAGEFAAGALKLPWDQTDPKFAVGLLESDNGASDPRRRAVCR